MANARIMVFKNNYLTQLHIKWSLDQTRDIAQCKTTTNFLNFNSKQCPKTNLEYNLHRSNSKPAWHLTRYKHLFQGNQRIQEEHNSLYFNFHLAECKYYWLELVSMNVSRNSWSVTKVRFTINLLLSVNDSGCQSADCRCHVHLDIIDGHVFSYHDIQSIQY